MQKKKPTDLIKRSYNTIQKSFPALLLAALFIVAFQRLIEFSPVSPRIEFRGPPVERLLFVPYHQSPLVIFSLAAALLLFRLKAIRQSIGLNPAAPWAAPLWAVGACLFLWAHRSGQDALLIISLSVTLLACAGLLGGNPAAKLMRLPALFLLLAVPIPGVLLNELIFNLQLIMASTTGLSLAAMGIPNQVSGTLVATASGVFQVIESCSGLRTIETMMMTAVIYQSLDRSTRASSWILVLSSPLIGLFVNQLRILTIILNPFSQFSEVHTLQGIVMAVLGVLLIAGLSSVLKRASVGTYAHGPEVGERRTSNDSLPAWPVGRFSIASLALVSLILFSGFEAWEIDRSQHLNPTKLEARFDGWTLDVLRPDEQFLGSTTYTQSILRSYARGDESVSVLVAADARTEPILSGRSPKTALLGPGWRVSSEYPLAIDGLPANAMASIQRNAESFALAIYWQQGTRGFWAELSRNFLGIDRSPFQRPYSGVYARVSSPLAHVSDDETAGALQRMQPFIEAVLETFPNPVSDSDSNQD